MKRQIALVYGSFAIFSACGVDLTLPEYVPKCARPAPLLAGSWTGTLGGQSLAMQLTEKCVPPAGFGDSDHWEASGRWQWRDLSGPVSANPYYSGNGTPLVLSLDPPLQTRESVLLWVPEAQIPAATRRMTGVAIGSWPKVADTTQVLARFDSVAFDVTRP